MDILLTDSEVRVLGSLMEKEMATPDYYPLSLNALVNACNQKSNRNPVVSYSEDEVIYALKGLQERKLVRQSNVGRVSKYEQIFTNEFNFVSREAAIVCVLLVRGPQTVGEIRGRTERLHAFESLEEVQETLDSLAEMDLVMKLPRQPGRKESRYSHLLSGEPEVTTADTAGPAEPETVIVRKKDNRLDELEEQVESLREELKNLQDEFAAFKAQFE